MGLQIRERPSLALSVLTTSPVKYRQRWGWDDPNPIFAPKDVSFGTTMPGGFDRFTATLERKPDLSYPDDDPMSTITVTGRGGSVAWQGRIEKLPDVGGYQAQETVEAVGWQATLEDDKTVREIYADCELARWEGPTVAEQLALVSAGYAPQAATVSASPNGSPAILTQVTGPWVAKGLPVADAWYDAHGIPIESVSFSWVKGANVNSAETAWEWFVICAQDDTGTGAESSGNLRGAGPGNGTLVTAGPNKWALIRAQYNSPGGEDGVLYAIYWSGIGVYGRHGLQGYGPQPVGLLASDIVRHAVGKWAPKLAQIIVPSTFIIPQLAFLEPTTVAEIIKQATRFELQDWAVWEGPTFYMNPRGERGKKWKARVGPAQLQETGPQVSRIYNGVMVQYTDVAGKIRMVGPPGFAGGTAATEDPQLADPDPENPLNLVGVKKWAQLKMGTSTAEGAKAVGRIFLQESKQLDKSGQATLTGHVEDEQGNYWPAWAVRAGDTIRFSDAADTSPRTITSTSYADSGKSNVLQLGQPSDNLQAVLERLSASIISTGLQ